jgi:hypothetical protein
MAGVLQVRCGHAEARKCYGPKINKDELIKVTIDLVEPMRGRDTI